jgi:hypothetical protein
MRVCRILFLICAITIVALFYVHQQVELVKLSYAVESGEKGLSVLLDQREKLVYNLNNLSSPSRLERILVARKVDVEYPAKEQVIRVVTRWEPGSRESLKFARASKRGIVDNLLELIGMGPEAHAKER